MILMNTFLIRIFAIILISSCIASKLLSTCLILHSDFAHQCLKCRMGYILDQSGTQCNEIIVETINNCIQISEIGECIRCDCGFVQQEQINQCIISPPHLIGCESFIGQDICQRPKHGFLLIKSFSGEVISIKNNAGSNCEIFNQIEGICKQCHSGYLLNSQYLCEIFPHPIHNQFFTYFSSDGQLQSRSFQFHVSKNGVYFSILNCEIHQEIEGFTQCLKCQNNKIPNKSHKKCFKKPFQNCGVVSDTNSQVCEECVDNFHFYLSDKQDACFPRQLDPIQNCLESSEINITCLKCAKGLVNTLLGCDLETQKNLELEEVEKQTIISIRQIGRSNPNCIFWINENRCGICQNGLILDTEGNCRQTNITNCLQLNKSNSCFKCKQNFFYNKEAGNCEEITIRYCILVFGIEDICEMCQTQHYLIQDKHQCQYTNVNNCVILDGKQNECLKCMNLFYLLNSTYCAPIDEKDCFLSNGISNKCIQCKRNRIQNQQGTCILSLLIIDQKRCNDSQFFVSNNNICIVYSFKNFSQCFKYHPTQNECLECNHGLFLDENQGCSNHDMCVTTNGINKYCYQANIFQFSYINSKGEVLDSECMTNYIEMTCINNSDHNKVIGILTECNGQVLYWCLHQKEQNNGQCICEICQNLFYPDINGDCLSINVRGCKVSNGRSKKCIICQQKYELDYQTELCELRKDLVFLDCEEIKENSCIKCNNLFHLINNQCLPIDDPDCIQSDGIQIKCIVCKGIQMQHLEKQLSCFSPCEKYDEVKKICISCQLGFIPMLKMSIIKEEYIKFCEFNTIYKCQQLTSEGNCNRCEEGYHKMIDGNIMICIEGFIENCKVYHSIKKQCETCEEGFILLSDQTCYKIQGCLESENMCLKCDSNYILLNKSCLTIPHCISQQEYQCFLCQSGYSLKIFHRKAVTHQLLKQEISQLFDICEKILNCIDSNGITADCLVCDEGFMLIQGICIQENEFTQNCLKQDDKNKCIECENLFYIEEGECMNINKPYCQQNNGVSVDCVRCIFDGYKLNDHGECEIIDCCIISDGKEACIVCEQNFILDDIGSCQKTLVEIPNCLEYSFNFKDKQLSQKNSKEIFQTLNYEKQQYYCTKCQSYYSLLNSNFTACQLINQTKIINCLQTDGIIEECSICKQESLPFLLHQKSDQNQKFECLPYKSGVSSKNIGCQYFNLQSQCMKCFSSFYLDTYLKCKPRHLIKKCDHFHPKKDECQSCRSGYILKKIHMNKSVCIPLSESNKVKDCQEYQANSNKCIQCKKYLQFDIVEFILDEINNRCKSVLHLMCNEFDHIHRKCLIKFIINCEVYHNLQGCSQCSNGFYITPQFNCQSHERIQNCLIYSQIQSNQCDQCEKFFYLSSNNSKCSPIFIINCRVASNHLDQCLQCENKQEDKQLIFYTNFISFAIEKITRSCIESKIANCKIFEIFETRQKCLKCKENFIVAKGGKECLLKIQDKHCTNYSSENKNENKCIECEQNYLLTQDGQCIQLSGICQIQNCEEYDKMNSHLEEIKCELCSLNYFLDDNGKCQPFDPDSIIESEVTPNDNQSQNKTEIKYEIFVGLILSIALSLLCYFMNKKRFQKQQIQQEEDENEEDHLEKSGITQVEQFSSENQEKQVRISNNMSFSHLQIIELPNNNNFL